MAAQQKRFDLSATQVAALGAGCGLVGVVVGAWLDYNVRSRETDVKMVEIALWQQGLAPKPSDAIITIPKK